MTRVANSSRTTTADRGDTRRKDSEAWEYYRERERERERERGGGGGDRRASPIKSYRA